MADIPLVISSPHSTPPISAERRITPSWSLAQLKSKLEPVTGIPPSCQSLRIRSLGDEGEGVFMVDAQLDEESVHVAKWIEGWRGGRGEILVTDTRPPSQRLHINPSSVPKYIMPESTYASLPSTVLSWKKTNHLGRFDPNAPEIEKRKVQAHWQDVEDRHLTVGSRCRLLPAQRLARHGVIKFVDAVPNSVLPGPQGAPWVGVELDEPQGKNDGSAGGQRFFEAGSMRGVFVRPERVEAGDFPVRKLEEDEEDDDLEEI
ncbi:MAG: hypothetical protein MMC33_002619 [Icmadophila ericetorum]|nr:hypothetical protein [Icmadophila ericetorum]